MNREFAKYDKNSQRTVYMKTDILNRVLEDAGARIQIVRRDVALRNAYQNYLEQETIDRPELSIKEYEKRYFMASCETVTDVNLPASAQIRDALGVKTVSIEWAKDYYGNYTDDEIELRYNV